MDTITHTLFGLALYGAIDKKGMERREKTALLVTALAGSQIPDIDVVSSLWDTNGNYQMWHRGLTHSIFLVPIWALLLAGLAKLIWGVGGKRPLLLAALAVFIHDTSDLFNAWGTGYLEPFSQMRITFGTIPIIDLVMWAIIGIGFAVSRWKKLAWPRHMVFRSIWALLVLHIAFQTAQGAALYEQAKPHYEQVALSADFIPGVFTVVGKNGHVIELSKGTVWRGVEVTHTLTSAPGDHLEKLFAENPKARTLYRWSPFVVIVDDENRLGIYDPRFYRNGESFLFEFIEKRAMK